MSVCHSVNGGRRFVMPLVSHRSPGNWPWLALAKQGPLTPLHLPYRDSLVSTCSLGTSPYRTPFPSSWEWVVGLRMKDLVLNAISSQQKCMPFISTHQLGPCISYFVVLPSPGSIKQLTTIKQYYKHYKFISPVWLNSQIKVTLSIPYS